MPSSMHIHKCTSCSSPVPANDSFLLHGSPYCAQCIETARKNIGADASAVVRAVDPTICSKCGRDSIEGEWATSDGVPVCDTCAANQSVAALPWWLKNSIAVLAVLLVFALVHGSAYVSAVRDTYRAEKKLKKGNGSQAVALLSPVVERFPSCERCVLDLALADLAVGDAANASKVTDAHGNFSDDVNELSAEVQRGFDKVDEASKKLDEIGTLLDADKPQEAQAKLDEAQKTFPNWNIYPEYQQEIDANKAFLQKDWDGYAAIRKQQLDEYPKNAFVMAGYTSALAAKYAATGDESLKQAALHELEETKVTANGNKKAEEMYSEFSPRIEHRLRTRLIIDKAEYDGRFRPELAKKMESK